MLIAPLKWVYRISGIAPSGSTSDKYFTALALLLSVGANLVTVQVSPSNDDIVENSIWLMLFAFYSAAPVCFLISNLCWKRSFNDILLELRVRGEDLSVIENFRMQKIVILACLSIGIPLLCFTLFPGELMIFSSLWIISYVVYVLPMTQMVVLVDLIHNRFLALNSQLTDLNMEYDNKPLHAVKSRLDSVFQLHTQLHILVWKINAHFCLYNFLSTISKVGTAVYKMHEYLRTLSGHTTWFWNVLFWIPTIWEFNAFILQICVCHACAQEANRSAMLAHRVLRPDTAIQLWELVGLFSRLTLHHKVRFSVGRVFTLDRSLISKMGVTALSYLIIVVQLRSVEPYVGGKYKKRLNLSVLPIS
ncbi:hypothetical protein J6590_085700 [Homalodisca vitripennis]|nr:hypothetical protein J6590_085700 [Homalodisca vitripennis]